jgi:hypothetical protein
VTKGGSRGQIMLGIYEVSGDRLRFCYAVPGRDARGTSRPRPAVGTRSRKCSVRNLDLWRLRDLNSRLRRCKRRDPSGGALEGWAVSHSQTPRTKTKKVSFQSRLRLAQLIRFIQLLDKSHDVPHPNDFTPGSIPSVIAWMSSNRNTESTGSTNSLKNSCRYQRSGIFRFSLAKNSALIRGH